MEKDKKEEDFDFDFSIYEKDQDEKQEVVGSLKELKRPTITGLRSRFSNGEAELEKFADLGDLISKYSIKVESRVQDIKELWKFYGLLSEFWECIRNIFGSNTNTDIDNIKRDCVKLLEKNEEGKVSLDVHKKLLELRSWIYRLKQLVNLGIETEKGQRGIYAKAKKGITQ